MTPSQSPPARSNAQRSPKKVILVVEDNISVLTTIRYTLAMEGFTVLTARSGEEAIDLLQHQIPDLIVSDIMMPGIDGYTLYKKVQEIHRLNPIPFIFLTAKADKQDIRIGKAMGVDDYIVKPFEPLDLVAAVKGKLLRLEEQEIRQEKELERLSDHLLTYLFKKIHAPLSLIRGWMHILLDPRYDFNDDELKKIYHTVFDSCNNMDQLLENFTMLAKLQGYESSETYMQGSAVFSLNDLMDYVCNKWSTLHPENHVDITMPDETIYIKGHTGHLAKIIEELLQNARKFTPDPQQVIQIKVFIRPDAVKIECHDKGRGIAVSDLDRVFDKFFQGNTEKTAGTGLGLALLKMIVELHGGAVSVESIVDQGSVFRFTLPRAHPSPEELEQIGRDFLSVFPES